MKKLVFGLLCLCFLVPLAAQERSVKYIKNVFKTVGLPNAAKNKKTVLLINDEKVRISTTLDLFKKVISAKVKRSTYPKSRAEELLALVVEECGKSKHIVVQELLKNHKSLTGIIERLIAELLETGACWVWVKKDRKHVPLKTLQVQTLEYNCGPLCYWGGRVFYSDSIPFFRITDRRG